MSHIKRMVLVAIDTLRRARGYGLVMASEAFQVGFADGVAGHRHGVPLFKGSDVYRLGFKLGSEMRADLTTTEGAE